MQALRFGGFGVALIVALAFAATSAHAQGQVPADLADLVRRDLDASQKTMTARGWEIVYSSLAKKVQYYWNEGSKTCVSLKLKGKEIEGFTAIDNAECTSLLAEARKVWEGYSNGQASASSPSLDAERKKLSGQGFKATYWVKNASPDRSIEYWLSADGKTCTGLVFGTTDGAFVKTSTNKPEQCANPAPKK